MSEAEAVKALREWCAASVAARSAVESDIKRWSTHQNTSGFGRYAVALDLARAALAAAPALLARIEAGEGLLREAGEGLASMSMQQGRPSKVLLKDIDAIAVFLAAKEADRG